jgi:TonB-dependent receptor
MMKKQLILCIALMLCAKMTIAQNQLEGRIVDAKSMTGLANVVVKANKGEQSAKSDSLGNFVLKGLKSDIYILNFSLVGYYNLKSDSILIPRINTDIMLFKMDNKKQTLTNIVIKETKKTFTEKAVMQEIKSAQATVSGVSAAQIQKSADRNAADVVKRIPGITIVNDRFINVRGLSERYNEVWLNNATAPSSESDVRAFSFDALPAGVIDRILIYKTPSAEISGNFGGGMVKIFTQTIPDKKVLSITYSTSIRPGTTFENFNYTQRSNTDILGFDNSLRVLPNNLPAYINKNDSDANTVSKSFLNNWKILKENAMPDQRLSINFQNKWKIKKIEIGNVSAASYSNTRLTNNVYRADYDSLTQNFAAIDLQNQRNVQVALMENIAVKFKKHKIEFKNLLNQSGKENTTQRLPDSRAAVNTDQPYKYYAMGYSSKFNWLSQLAGTHKLYKDILEYDWTASYTKVFKNEPDLRRINFSFSDIDSTYKASVANVLDPINGGGRVFQELDERNITFNHNFKWNVDIKKQKVEFTCGNFIENKTRSFNSRLLGFTIKPSLNAFVYKGFGLDSIFNNAHVGDNGFKIDEGTSLPDSYTAGNKLIATYIAASTSFEKFKIKIGVRNENNSQTLNSYTTPDSSSKVNLDIKTNFYLPSLNMSYNISEKSLVRFAYGHTLNRPEFREMAPFFFYDFEFRNGNYGSLYPTVYYPKGISLNVATIQNVDLRYEHYASGADNITIGAFYKKFKNPIQRVFTADNKGFTFINGESSTITGAELDMRIGLSHISEQLSNFTAVFNTSILNSNLVLPTLANLPSTSRMTGQSPYIINGGIYYQNDSSGISASVLYNVFGPRLFVIGSNFYGNIIEMPVHSLDALLSYKLLKHLKLTLSAQNILNSKNELRLDANRNSKIESNELYLRSYKTGTYYSIGIKWNIIN